ncbi:helix-turn-helix domain-containing protein [Priestia aryabhattai]|uniref:helix-turn-helix domain-containing protein n=1 Tax=Priestia aryabhattai TaxID=412384 RepID=UPI0025A4B941|nr:helix-turn-helix domain-containing protein [Priestia aryabhattai]WJN45176.1 helix-turn-helix domain-containing protein [Priestia aryabhattai]
MYFQDRLDKAIEYLLNSADRKGEPRKLAFNAWSDSGKFFKVRAKYHDSNFVDFQHIKAGTDTNPCLDVKDWLERSTINEHYKDILFLLAEGKCAHEIASLYSKPVKTVWVWINRARKEANKQKYLLEVI